MRTTLIMLTAGALVLGAACDDSVAPDRASLDVTWMEWPAQVTATQPGSIRVVTSFSCGALRLDVTAADDRILVSAEREVHPAVPCDPLPTHVDTLIPLPVLDAGANAGGKYYWIDALVLDRQSPVLRLHTFGRIYRQVAYDGSLVVGGRASLFRETNGCDKAFPIGRPPVAVTNLPSDTTWWHASNVVLGGEYVTTLPPPACGTMPAVRLTHLEMPVR